VNFATWHTESYTDYKLVLMRVQTLFCCSCWRVHLHEYERYTKRNLI